MLALSASVWSAPVAVRRQPAPARRGVLLVAAATGPAEPETPPQLCALAGCPGKTSCVSYRALSLSGPIPELKSCLLSLGVEKLGWYCTQVHPSRPLAQACGDCPRKMKAVAMAKTKCVHPQVCELCCHRCLLSAFCQLLEKRT